MSCLTKLSPLGWKSWNEACVCLLLVRALIYFRMQCLWFVVLKCVCSVKCILFVWVCFHHLKSSLRAVCVMWVYRAGVRTEPRWQCGSRARPDGGRTDGMVVGCLSWVHAHTQPGWHYSSLELEEPDSPPQLPGRTTTVTLHRGSHGGRGTWGGKTEDERAKRSLQVWMWGKPWESDMFMYF